MTSIIKIPRKTFVDGELFYASQTSNALRNCQEDCDALFMPEVIDARISSPNESPLWQNFLSAPSVRATGVIKGEPVVVYAHVPNHFSNPDNIELSIQNGLRNGAGIIPQDEFQRFYDMVDNEIVFLVDYNKLLKSTSGVIKVKDALQHPQTIPFLGGKERVGLYLEEHERNFGPNIGVLLSNDLQLDGLSVARVLHVGDGLYGDNHLD